MFSGEYVRIRGLERWSQFSISDIVSPEWRVFPTPGCDKVRPVDISLSYTIFPST